MTQSSLHIEPFYDEVTGTVSYVLADTQAGQAAVIDPVLDLEPKSGTLTSASSDRIIEYLRKQQWQVQWILETHAHADHLSGAQHIRHHLGGKIAIGRQIQEVQKLFREVFHFEPGFHPDGRQFDYLFDEDEVFHVGALAVQALLVPGHTPADMAYRVEDAVFVGDTLFLPDVGTARADFPGGNASTLYRSIKRLLSMPDETRLFVCHDYPPAGRGPAWVSTVADQRAHNIHVHDGVTEAEFIQMRTKRDATLAMPTLILPSVQVNVRAGKLPPSLGGRTYIQLPINAFIKADEKAPDGVWQ